MKFLRQISIALKPGKLSPVASRCDRHSCRSRRLRGDPARLPAGNGKNHGELLRRSFLRMDCDPSPMLLDDLVYDGKTQAYSLADGLRREERIEYPRENFLRDASAVVDHLLRNVLGPAHSRNDCYLSFLIRSCLRCIRDQIEQHLIDL